MAFLQQVYNYLLKPYSVRTSQLSDQSVIQHVALVDVYGNTSGDYILETAVSGVYTYFGKAVAGTLTSAAAWQVRRIDQTVANAPIVLFGGAVSTFTNVWDNRASLTYG